MRHAVVKDGVVINVIKLKPDWNDPSGDPKNRWTPPEGCMVVSDPQPEVIDNPNATEANEKMLSRICAEVGDEYDGQNFKGARYEKAVRDFEAKRSKIRG
jgi:hypothetical protein